MKVKTCNMKSPISGNRVPNLCKIYTNKYVYFQSYQSIIARTERGYLGKPTLDKNYLDYSKTTLRFLKLFLGTNKTKKEIEQDIKSGVYKLTNLN